MNDDGRLASALVQGNEVKLHHAPETPGISLDCRDPRVGRRALQTRDEDCDVAMAAATAVYV